MPVYTGYIGICGSKGYGFSAILMINRVLILTILVLAPLGIFLRKQIKILFQHYNYKTINKTVPATMAINKVSDS